MNTIPDALINAFRRGDQVVLLLGAGFSAIETQAPTWKQLLILLYTKLSGGTRPRSGSFYLSLDHLQQAQFLYDRWTKSAVAKTLQEILGETVLQPKPIHRSIVELPVASIMTTNWDSMAERACKMAYGTQPKAIWSDKQLAKSETPEVIKLHGSLEEPESLVFSEDDYYRHLAGDTKTHLVRNKVLTLLAEHSLLIFGYSLGDPDLKTMLSYLRERLRRDPNIYMFVPNLNSSLRGYLMRRGLTPIGYSGSSPTNASKKFISDLHHEIGVARTDSPKKRLEALIRVNKDVSKTIDLSSPRILRNMSNLGPFATPDRVKDENLFGSKEITELEVEAARSWRSLIKSGWEARCIVSIDPKTIRDKYAPSVLERLVAMRKQILQPPDRVTFVVSDILVSENVGIYDDYCMFQTQRLGTSPGCPDGIVTFRPSAVRAKIEEFDLAFENLQKRNRQEAGSRGLTQEEYIVGLIDEAIDEIKKL